MSTKENNIKITRCQRTPDREAILNLLVEYRCLTTGQIRGLLQTRGSSKTLRRVQSDLQTLGQAGMVESFPVLPELGPRSELAWILLKPGARWTRLEFRYGNHFRRLPSPEQLAYTSLKLELEETVARLRGWQLERPQIYNRIQPLPARTPQYYRLAEALTWQEWHNSGRWPVGGVKGSHTLGIAFKANDYVAYTTPREVPAARLSNKQEEEEEKVTNAGTTQGVDSAYSEHAVVFILCPPKASEKFWLARIREYQSIATRLLVVGVFENEEKALNHKSLLFKGGLRVTTLSRISTILDDIWKP